MKTQHAFLTLIIAVTLAACSATPKRIAELEEARTAVQQVETSPLAGQYAAKEVEEAHNALLEADRLAQDKKSIVDIRQMAYMAKRHADIAAQQIAEAQAKAAVEKGEADRAQALAQSQLNKAAQAQEKAELSADEAQRRAQILQDELEQLKAKQTDRGLVLTLGDVLFDTGKSTLKSGAMATLDRLADFLKQAPERSVIIEGHTDSVGSDDYNMELSQRRADAVKAALLQRGVAAERVVSAGKGEAFPVAGNDTAAGRQQNRRVEIIISNPQNVAG